MESLDEESFILTQQMPSPFIELGFAEIKSATPSIAKDSTLSPSMSESAATQRARAEAAKICQEIIENMPSFQLELEHPELATPILQIGFDELNKPAQDILLRLDVNKVLNIMRQFFLAVEEQVGRETAFLLLYRSKAQIRMLFPVLDYFDVTEDLDILRFTLNARSISANTLLAISNWVYLFIVLLRETASAEACEKVMKRAYPETTGPEETLFLFQLTSIQI
ncbi:MAG: hypothetical protein AB1489_01760 [Acidobacteriota bacterium]